ncbi:IS91 family transposase, partial [Faecalibacillus intestinalis]|nr:IS91 family transposase [Faecalibacillus intestinalis]
MLVGDFMIDDTNYADCLALYNFNRVDKIKGKKSFPYIFNDNINYIRSLYNRGKIRNITYDTIQKTILCGFIYLGYDLFV